VKPVERRLLLDTDVGMDVDDAYCLALAALSPELRLLGVTTVYGNVQNRARIAAKLLRLCGRPEVPVAPGASRPLGGAPFPFHPHLLQSYEEGGHEGRGILDPQDPEVIGIAPVHGALFLMEAVRAARGPVSVAAMGPLTNIAVALALAPDLVERIDHVFMMGGYFDPEAPTLMVGGYRLPPESEYNLSADPWAAEIVFRSGVPITLCPRETTNRVPTTTAFLEALAARPAPLVKMLLELTRIWAEVTQASYAARGVEGAVLRETRGWLHDPLALMPAIASGLTRCTRVSMRFAHIDGRFRTIPDPAGPYSVDVVTDVNEDAFYAFLRERLTGAPGR
jgi:inosine-uridine nucleoside N-ribohydrolase